MQSVLASLLVPGTERQEIRLRLTDDTLYFGKQELSYSSSCLPRELQTDPTLLTKVKASATSLFDLRLSLSQFADLHVSKCILQPKSEVISLSGCFGLCPKFPLSEKAQQKKSKTMV